MLVHHVHGIMFGANDIVYTGVEMENDQADSKRRLSIVEWAKKGVHVQIKLRKKKKSEERNGTDR